MEYMDLLPPTAPSLVFARETCTPYWQTARKPTDTLHIYVGALYMRSSSWRLIVVVFTVFL